MCVCVSVCVVVPGGAQELEMHDLVWEADFVRLVA